MSIENKMNTQELCSFISYFENIDPDKACQWKGGEKREDGVITMPYPIYEKEFMEFVETFYKSEISLHDYQNELNQRVPDWQTVNMNAIVETADFELIRAILTKCIRVERFCDGAWDSSIRSGLFLDILRRLNTVCQPPL